MLLSVSYLIWERLFPINFVNYHFGLSIVIAVHKSVTPLEFDLVFKEYDIGLVGLMLRSWSFLQIAWNSMK